jgi:protein tyrosine phosphatase (PTP) superfamily phosphohydrolase (DUF442 family)
LAFDPVTAGKAYPGLKNVIECGHGVLNGSVPEGEAGWESLVQLGVKSVICVEADARGADRAKSHGLRHVHVPISYGGIPAEARPVLVRAVETLPKPIYIHCQHGVHRSPAAAGYALVSLGLMTNQEAVDLMRTAGTSTHYRGLYSAVESASKLDAEVLAGVSTQFPERVFPSGIRAQMAALGRAWHHLEDMKAEGWMPPQNHPDIDPETEASWVRNILAEAELDLLEKAGKDCQALRDNAVRAADAFVSAIAEKQKSAIDSRFVDLHKSCIACHERFRDLP